MTSKIKPIPRVKYIVEVVVETGYRPTEVAMMMEQQLFSSFKGVCAAQVTTIEVLNLEEG